MNVVRHSQALFASFILALSQDLPAIDIYNNDFEGTVGPEWSSSSMDVTPIAGRRFLGQFTNEKVTLQLVDIPTHSSLTVSFKLFVILSWDGNKPADDGPDVWTLKHDGAATLTATSFCNWEPGDIDPIYTHQAYPETFPGGDFPCRTNAAEVNSLGYVWPGFGTLDSVYNLSITFPHTENKISLDFQGIGLQPVGDESWGIDDVKVSIMGEAFAAFGPRAEFTLGPNANDDSYWVRGWLKLAKASNGIDPLTEAVTIKVGPFSHTLPAGSFRQDGASYLFKGPVGASTLDVRITASPKPGGYSFKSCLKKGELAVTTLQPQVQLTIGDDSGQATLDVGYAKFGKGAIGQNWVFPPTK